MTVQELIERLSQFPPEMKVKVPNFYYHLNSEDRATNWVEVKQLFGHTYTDQEFVGLE